MFLTLFLLIILRQILFFMDVGLLYFSLSIPLLLLCIEVLRKRPNCANFIGRVDSFFLGLIPVQLLLIASMQIETWFSGRNFFLSFFASYLLPFVLMGYFYGLVFLGTSNPNPSLWQFLQVFLVIWLTFYLRLRMGYLNYYNLGIDTLSVSCDEILKLYKDKYNLSFNNYFHPKEPIILVSLRYSSVQRWKDDIRLSYQTRGMYSVPRAIFQGTAKIVSEHPVACASLATGVMGAAVAVMSIRETLKLENHKMDRMEKLERERMDRLDKIEHEKMVRAEKLEHDKRVIELRELEYKEKQLQFEIDKFKASQNPGSPSNNPPSEVSFNECDSSIVTLLYTNAPEVLSVIFSI